MIYNAVTNLSFRQFLELEKVQPSYIDALGQLGVDPDNAAGSDTTPHYTGNFINPNDHKFYTGATFTVKLLKDGAGKPSVATITLADVWPAGVYSRDKSGKWVQETGKYQPGQSWTVSVDTLNKMLNPEAETPMQGASQPPNGLNLPGGGL